MDRPSRPHRFFVPDLSDERIDLSASEAHHALHVLRLKADAAVELFDGRGAAATGRIVRAGRRGVSVAVGRRQRRAARCEPHVHLAFAVPKGKRLDWLLEKATELQAASLQPVIFQRSVASGGKMPPDKRPRWNAVCIAAAKQSGGLFLPELREPVALRAFVDSAKAFHGLLGAPGRQAASVPEALSGRAPARPIALLVGPEGGLTDAEQAAAKEAGFRTVRLGQATLRIETAAVALLAAAVSICQ